MRQIALAFTAALLAGSAAAQPAPAPADHGHMAMPAGSSAKPSMSGSAAEPSMMESMDKMNKAMSSAPMTGDADHDFVVMMLPHHQGAVDMARFELAHGKDPALQKLAREIVAAQDKEIAFMKSWLAKHPAK